MDRVKAIMIVFPIGEEPFVGEFADHYRAETYSRKVFGTAYIFAHPNAHQLGVLSSDEITALFTLAKGIKPGRKTGEVMTQAIMDELPRLAKEGEARIRKLTKGRSKMEGVTPDKKGISTPNRAKKQRGPGRVSPLEGKKLVKTEKGRNARRSNKTRRTQSWKAVRSGSTYEKALENGAHPSDIATLVREGHLKAE